MLDKPLPPWRSITQVASELHKDPLDTFIDLALERHLKQFFIQPLVNEDQNLVLAMMRHPRSVVTFSDSGAHVSQIMDSSIQTHLLGYWVREKQALTLEQASAKSVRPRLVLGFQRIGACCARVMPPTWLSSTRKNWAGDADAGVRSAGWRTPPEAEVDRHLATIVSGKVLLRNNEHTGALPGQLLRGPLAI